MGNPAVNGQSTEKNKLEESFLALYRRYFELKLNCRQIVLMTIIEDRIRLSEANSWHDKDGIVYCYINQEKTSELMQCNRKTVSKTILELQAKGLVWTIPQGCNKPNRIYTTEPMSKKVTPECDKKSHPDDTKRDTNKSNIIKNKVNKSKLSTSNDTFDGDIISSYYNNCELTRQYYDWFVDRYGFEPRKLSDKFTLNEILLDDDCEDSDYSDILSLFGEQVDRDARANKWEILPEVGYRHKIREKASVDRLNSNKHLVI